MTKSRSVRAKAPAMVAIPQSQEEAIAGIARVGDLRDRIAALKAEAEARVRAIGEELERAVAQPAAELAEAERGVQTWCEAHRAELTKGGRVKTVEFGTGRVLWRQRPPRVTIRGIEAAIAICRSFGFGQFLRTRVEINKEAMLADPDRARLVAGVTVSSEGEDFVIEPAGLDVAEGR